MRDFILFFCQNSYIFFKFQERLKHGILIHFFANIYKYFLNPKAKMRDFNSIFLPKFIYIFLNHIYFLNPKAKMRDFNSFFRQYL